MIEVIQLHMEDLKDYYSKIFCVYCYRAVSEYLVNRGHFGYSPNKSNKSTSIL